MVHHAVCCEVCTNLLCKNLCCANLCCAEKMSLQKLSSARQRNWRANSSRNVLRETWSPRANTSMRLSPSTFVKTILRESGTISEKFWTRLGQSCCALGAWTTRRFCQKNSCVALPIRDSDLSKTALCMRHRATTNTSHYAHSQLL